MDISIIVYHIIFVIVLFFGYLSYKLNEWRFTGSALLCCFISFIVIFLFSGLRFYVGDDYNSYVDYFRGHYITKWEPGYHFLNQLFLDNINGYKYVIFIASFITYYFLYKSLRQEKIIFHGLIFYLLLFYCITNTFIRQGIAASLFLYSIKYIKQERFFAYLCFILFGAFFHYSIFFLLPFYFIGRFSISKKVMVILIIVVGFIIFYPSNLISTIFLFASYVTHYGSYYAISEYAHSQNNSGIGILIKILMGLIVLMRMEVLLIQDEKNRIYINMLFIGLLLTLFATKIAILGRLAYYFNLTGIFVYAFYFKSIKFKSCKLNKLVFLILLVVLSIALFEVEFYTNDNNAIPYSTIFDN